MGVAGEVSRRGLTHRARGLLVRAVWQSKVPNGMVSFPPNGGAPHNTCAHSCIPFQVPVGDTADSRTAP